MKVVQEEVQSYARPATEEADLVAETEVRPEQPMAQLMQVVEAVHKVVLEETAGLDVVVRE